MKGKNLFPQVINYKSYECLTDSVNTQLDVCTQLSNQQYFNNTFTACRPINCILPCWLLRFIDLYLQHVEPLVQQCIDWCDSYKMPLIIPLTSWLPDPRPALVAVVSDAKSTLKVCPTRNAQHIFCADSDHVINMYHVPSGKHVRAFAGKYWFYSFIFHWKACLLTY